MPRPPRQPDGPRPFHVTITRYVNEQGKRCKKSAPGARKVTEQSDTYYADLPSLMEGAPSDRVSLETTDIGAAWVRLRELLAERQRQAEGIIDPSLAHARKPLMEHLGDWLKALEGEGRTEAKQRDLMRGRLESLFSAAGWTRLAEISLGSAQIALGQVQSTRAGGMPRKHPGRSAQTRNHYHAHLRQFVLWCMNDGRLLVNPLRKLKMVNVETDRRHDRRCPTDDEVRKLFDHLHGRGEKPARLRKRMTGPQRALGYQVSMATGFRAGELASLSRESFDLAVGTVVARAGYSKRRRKDTQHLPDWLTAELRVWFDAGGECWGNFSDNTNWPGRLLQADLLAAGVAYEIPSPDGPLFFDFHALRHWYCTQVANQPGISPKTLMALCRHSTPTLSLKIYAKVRDQEARAAAQQVPRPPGSQPGPAT